MRIWVNLVPEIGLEVVRDVLRDLTFVSCLLFVNYITRQTEHEVTHSPSFLCCFFFFFRFTQ